MAETDVLVVASPDDEEALSVSTFASDGYDVLEVTDATAAVARLDGERPGCLVVHARADWTAVFERAAASDPPIPVVLVVDGDGDAATAVVGAVEWGVVTTPDDILVGVEEALEADARLRERYRASEQLASFFEHSPDPTLEYEFADGEPVIRAVNRAFVETFGYDREGVVGRPMNDVLVPPEKTDEATHLDERVAAGEEVTAEVRRETADGQQAFLFKNIPVDVADGGLDGYGIYVDISAQKARERRLQEQNDRLNDFASVVTHDLRGPMGVLKNHLDIARHTGDIEHVEQAGDALERMDEFVRDLLQLAREGEDLTGLEPVSLAETAETAWNHVATGDAGLALADNRHLLADSGRLTQLLENLYINAVQHNDGDVTLTVGATDDGQGFFVADDGRGIPQEERNQVFKSGYTTDDGTGYGLTIVRQVASAHGWDVAIAASDDGGARFEFRDVAFADERDA
jgi:PAS domain S-box-containing protein